MVPGELSALPSGVKVFVDSNILTYHLLNDPAYGKRCKEFIGRVENREFEGFISPIIVSETLFNFIKAIYEEGFLKPLEEIGLKEKEEIWIEIKKRRINKSA